MRVTELRFNMVATRRSSNSGTGEPLSNLSTSNHPADTNRSDLATGSSGESSKGTHDSDQQATDGQGPAG